MSTSAIRAGRAFVEIFANDDKLRRTLKQSQARLQLWAANVSQTGSALLVPTAGIVAPLIAATRVFGGFEAEMSKVKARLDLTDGGFEKLQQQAIQLGKTTSFSATEIARAMTVYSEAGFDSAKISTIIAATTDLAAAGLFGMEEAADTVISTLNTFQLSAGHIPTVIDMLAKGSTESASDVHELAEAFKYAAPVAAAVDMPLQDLIGSLSLLHDAGIKADMAGTTVRGALLALTDPSKEAAEKMEQLGIQVKDAQGNLLPMTNIIGQFERALAGMGSADKLGAIGRIFDARQAAGFVKLVDFGAARLGSRIETIFNSQGHAAKVASIQMDNLRGDWKKLTGALESLGITITTSVVSPLRWMVDGMRQAVLFTEAWVKENKDLAATVIGIAVSLAAIAPAMLGLAMGLKLTAFAFQPIFFAMTLFRTGLLLGGQMALWVSRILMMAVVPALIAAVTFLKTAAMAVVALATKGLAALPGLLAPLLNPIVLLGLAIAGLGLYMLYSSGVIENSVASVKKLFRGLAGDVIVSWQAIKDALAAGDTALAMQIPVLLFQLAWARAAGFVTVLWSDMVQFFTNVWGEASKTLANIFLTAYYGIAYAFVAVIGTLKSVWQNFLEIFRNGWQTASNWIAKGILTVMAQFDDSINVDEALKELEKINQAEHQRIGLENTAPQLRDERDQQMAQIAADQEQSLANLDQMRQTEADAAERNRNARISEADAAVQEAQQKLQAAAAEAARKREEAEKRAAGAALPQGQLDGIGKMAAGGFQDLKFAQASDVRSREGMAAILSTFSRRDPVVDGVNKLVGETQKGNEDLAQIKRNTDPRNSAGETLGLDGFAFS